MEVDKDMVLVTCGLSFKLILFLQENTLAVRLTCVVNKAGESVTFMMEKQVERWYFTRDCSAFHLHNNRLRLKYVKMSCFFGFVRINERIRIYTCTCGLSLRITVHDSDLPHEMLKAHFKENPQ